MQVKTGLPRRAGGRRTDGRSENARRANAAATGRIYIDPDYVRAIVPVGVPPIRSAVFAEGGGLVEIDCASGERLVGLGPSPR